AVGRRIRLAATQDLRARAALRRRRDAGVATAVAAAPDQLLPQYPLVCKAGLGKVEVPVLAGKTALGGRQARLRAGAGRLRTGTLRRSEKARHAHAARAKSDGEAEAQRQGLKHGRQFSLANVRTRAADRIGHLAPPLLGRFT